MESICQPFLEWLSAVPFGQLLQIGASIKVVNRSGGATSEL